MTTPAALGEQALRQLGVAVVPVAERPALTAPASADAMARMALIALGVIASDETALADDTALALERLRAVHDAMVAQGGISWSFGAVPTAVSDDYAMLAAIHLASSFGKTADPARVPVIEARVRRVAQIMRAPTDAETAVLDVHNMLAATGRVRWSSNDIPRPAEPAYVALAANQLAPSFGAKVDQAQELMARRTLAQLIALPTSGERTMAEYF